MIDLIYTLVNHLFIVSCVKNNSFAAKFNNIFLFLNNNSSKFLINT